MNPAAESRFARTELLYGEAAVRALSRAHVAVFGLGGVGGHVVEALARSGVGALTLVDHDWVSLSNLNRQIIATEQTLGQYKADAARDRVLSINPACRVEAYRLFFLPDTRSEIDFSAFDYVADAVDNVTAKLTLIEAAKRAGVPVISAMGTGNKLDPTRLRVADLEDTRICPLARVMRKECRKRGLSGVKVVYSEEEPIAPHPQPDEPAPPRGEEAGSGTWIRATPASNAIVPATAGLLLASEIINDIIKNTAE